MALALFVVHKDQIMAKTEGDLFMFCKTMGYDCLDATELLRVAFGFKWMRRKGINAIREKVSKE